MMRISLLVITVLPIAVCGVLAFLLPEKMVHSIALFLVGSGVWLGLMLYCSMYPLAQVFGRVMCQETTQELRAALTFDDGPHPDYTPQILDILKAADVKATFFLLGKYVNQFPEIVKRMHEDGHDIGNHSWTHLPLAFQTVSVIREELQKTNDVIRGITGKEVTLFRPPYGNRDPRVLAIANQLGMRTISWSITCWDWSSPPEQKIMGYVQRGLTPGAIVLLHDGHDTARASDRRQTVAATQTILNYLNDLGYTPVPVSQMRYMSIVNAGE